MRETILAAATPVLARDRGASMQSIAQAAGISRTSLTRLFPTRETLVTALADRIHARAAEALDAAELGTADFQTALTALTNNFLPLAQIWGVLSLEPHLLSQPALVARAEDLMNRLDEFFARGQREGHIRPELPPQWLSFTLFGLAETAWYLVLDEQMGSRQAPDFLLSMILHGAAKRD
ncbi:TetR family transcriptional regulator [Rhodococcus sp. OK611]|jgi:AcrR family transcriptional regulator|nr:MULTISPECIES: TetR/AcrR family transcriptional regulator [Rhodococcus]MCZ4557720.1 TetR/AcrR family transcriptional regulator [Rhodococcus maanshanensis]PTR43332.1 TetR family transcriptional regulator [Rhodococcus sp. OK611]SNX91195.1 transcriptional regulator, TetR family [Rhodococcus sp. OK270]